MLPRVLFIHGGGGGAYEADAALAENLRSKLGAAYTVSFPKMPKEDEPEYDTWKGIILKAAREMGDGAIFVGHSIGASVLAKVMTDEPPLSLTSVHLIAAPFWHDHDIWRWDAVALSEDAAERYPRGIPLHFYHGDADETVPVSHLDLYANALPFAHMQILAGRDHQLNNDMTELARDITGRTI